MLFLSIRLGQLLSRTNITDDDVVVPMNDCFAFISSRAWLLCVDNGESIHLARRQFERPARRLRCSLARSLSPSKVNVSGEKAKENLSVCVCPVIERDARRTNRKYEYSNEHRQPSSAGQK